MTTPPTVPVAPAPPRPRAWVGVVFICVGIAIAFLGVLASVYFTLAEGDSGGSNAPSVASTVGLVIGGLAFLAGVVVLIRAGVHRRARRAAG